MAERLGDRSYLADIQRGKRNVALVDLEVITLGFELTLSQLLTKVSSLVVRFARNSGFRVIRPTSAHFRSSGVTDIGRRSTNSSS